jgi:hypothetical protein
VPFPSLLSWLNYKPAKAMSQVEAEVTLRAAEAVAPTGSRVATAGMISGGGSIRALPATPMHIVSSSSSSSAVAGGPPSSGGSKKHPCVRIWGRCAHGETCLYKDAPEELCLAYLAGLCTGGGDDGSGGCRLIHQQVYGLPGPAEARPSSWQEPDLLDPSTKLSMWILRGQRSANRAEWQLWNQTRGGCLELLRDFFPPAAKEEVKNVKLEAEVASDGGGEVTTLDANDIATALDFI